MTLSRAVEVRHEVGSSIERRAMVGRAAFRAFELVMLLVIVLPWIALAALIAVLRGGK